MTNYSLFDNFLDSVFVVNEKKEIVYCNEVAATLCGSSVRRLVRPRPMHETIEFSDENMFVMPNGSNGRDEPLPYVEVKYEVKDKKLQKSGRVQATIQKVQGEGAQEHWIVILRDVTLEEVLHTKYHAQLQEKEVYIAELKEAQAQLENYSKNLEQMVEQRTQEVKRANAMLNAIMESLGQGFFAFDEKGICSSFYTRACVDILETKPSNQKVCDVLRVPESEKETFQMWVKALFAQQLPFETLKELGPALFKHSLDRHIKLEYYPIRDEKENLTHVVVVATDQTTEYQAMRAAEKEKKYARMILKLATNKRQFAQFLQNAKDVPVDLKNQLKSKPKELDHEYIYRVLHTLEGEAATYSAQEIWASAREIQEILTPVRGDEKYDVKELRKKLISGLDGMYGEYVQFMNKNKDLFSALGVEQAERVELEVQSVLALIEKLDSMGVSPEAREETAETLLKEPIIGEFKRYQDVVHLVAAKFNKMVQPVQFQGDELRLFLQPYREFFSTYVHVFRNAVDHGIEMPDVRKSKGKNPSGTIKVKFERFKLKSAPWIRVTVMDDGSGVPAKNLEKIFEQGFTTKAEVGEFSGRGVGLSAVRVEAERIGGRVWAESQVDAGTRIIAELPEISPVAKWKKAA